jgi:hypothetical protein
VSKNWWLDKEILDRYIQWSIIQPKKEWKHVVWRKIDGTGDHHVNQDKPSSERQISHFHSYAECRPKQKIII